jgi:hypothetical protein
MTDVTAAAQEINREHALARSCAESAVQHAIRCGQLLQSQKAFVGHGAFMPWVAAHCNFQYSTASRYMKAAAQSSTGVEISTLSKIFPSGRKSPPLPKVDEDPADSWYRQEWMDRIPMESGAVTFGLIGDKPAIVLVESRLNPGFWHDINLLEGKSSIRPCKPSALRWGLMRDATLATASWRTDPDAGGWLEGESDYWKQSDWRQRA